MDKCFVPSDVLCRKARSRGLDPVSQIIQHGLPIRKGFWSTNASSHQPQKTRKVPFFGKIEGETGDASDVLTSTKRKLREDLGLESDLPTCLIVGGGDGMGGLVQISCALGKKLGASDCYGETQYQMVVVCGNNREAKEALERVNWGSGVNVNVQGFVNNMDEWMNAADCLVTKAGPGTIAEASICGLPCMLFAYL